MHLLKSFEVVVVDVESKKIGIEWKYTVFQFIQSTEKF